METYKHRRSSVGSNRKHVQITPKYRYKMMRQEKLKVFCRIAIEESCKRHKIEIEILKVMEEHVHMIVDLPRGDVPELRYGVDSMNMKHIKKRGKVLFKDTVWEKKIKRLFGDSAAFDFKPFRRKIDFVFVDGCHTYDYMKNDTKTAFSILSKGGVI
ncbi:MAG: transposase [archaeon]